MDALSTSLDEIALSGLEGCTLRELWQFLESRQPATSFKLDHYTKSFIWNELCECADESDLIQFYLLPNPRECIPTVTSVWKTGSYDITEYSHPFPYRPVNSLGFKGSCSTFQKRKNITRELVDGHLTFDGVVEKHGDSLAIVGSQQLRERALLPGNRDPFIDISDVQYCLLEVVGSSRQYGIQRTAITSKYLKIDSRSTFHHVKTLVNAGLVSMKICPLLRLRSSTRGPHVLFLPRYTPPEWINTHGNPTEEMICSMIAAAPHRTLPVSVIRDRVQNQMSRKELQNTRSSLIKKGYIEQVTLEVTSAEDEDPDGAESVTKVSAYHLLRPYENESKPEVEEVEGEGEEEEEKGEEIDPRANTSVVMELPADMQAYRLIDSRGPEGITSTEFCERALALDLYACRRLAKVLIRTSAVTTVMMDDTVVRMSKLVSTRHLSACKEYRSMNEEKVKGELADLEIAVQSGDSMFQAQKEKERSKKRRQQAGFGSGDQLHGLASSSRYKGPAFGSLLEKAKPLSLLSQRHVQEPDSKDPVAPAMDVQNTGAAPPPISIREGLQDLATVSLTESERLSLEVNENCLNVITSSDAGPQPPSSTSTPDRRSPVPESESMPGSSQDPIPVSVAELNTVRKREQPPIILCTYNQLKRLNLIMGFMKDVRIMQSMVALIKYVQQAEAKEGKDKVIDRKTVFKLLNTLVMEKKLIKSSFEFKLREQPFRVPVYQLPSVTEAELTKAEEEAKAYYLNLALRKELRTMSKKGKIKRRDSSGDEEGDFKTASDDEEESFRTVAHPGTNSKYQRLRHFHHYLWILAHGTRPLREDEEGETPQDKKEDTSPPSFLSLTTFPWARTVHKLPVTSKGPGWLNFNDICRYMPLSLYTLLIRLYRGIVNSKYVCYFEDPQLKDKLIHELPRKLRRCLTRNRCDFQQVSRLVEQLVQEVGLVTLDGTLQSSSALYLYLNKTATILDTSKAFPRRSFFLEESRGLFTTLQYSLHSLSDLERYWFELQSICLQTPIILNERKLNAKKRKRKLEDESDEQEEVLYANDTFPLPYVKLPRRLVQTSEMVREFNAQGFGAGGLPPLCFSHLSRNWAQVTISSELEGMEVLGAQQDGEVYGPGVGLTQIPWTEMQMEYEEDSETEKSRAYQDITVPPHIRESLKRTKDDSESLPPATKKARLVTAVRRKGKTKVMVVRVPSSLIKKNTGGKGRQRFRMKMALEAAKKVKKARESVARYRIANKIAGLISDSTDMEGDIRAKEHKTRERVYWYPHEDSFLILAYLTSLVLNKKGQPAVTYSQIRDALHMEYQTSKDKGATAIRRRMIFILRKRQHLVDMVDICLAETLEEMDSMGQEAPDCNFDAVLLYILRRYQVQKGCLLSRGCMLPPTIRELRENYDIVGCQKEPEPVIPRPSTVEGDQERNRAHIAALIISSLGADKRTYDDYATFKIFETFPDADMKAALEDLKSQLVVRQKRTTGGIPRNKGPLESQSYELSSNFFSKLENPFPTDFFEEAAEFTGDMEAHRKLMANLISEQKPSEPVHSKVTRLAQFNLENATFENTTLGTNAPVGVQTESIKGSNVAALASIMFDDPSTLVSCEPVFPTPLLVPQEGTTDSVGTSIHEPSSSSHQLLKRKLEEEGDQSDEGEEEMQEVGEGGNEQSLPPLGGKLSWSEGVGVTSLLRIDENWLLQNGQLNLDLAISRGKILEPLPTEQCETVHPSTEEERNTSNSSADVAIISQAPPSVMSLDTYLDICTRRLQFSRADLNLAKSLYNVIECSGEKGISAAVLSGTVIDSEYYSYTIDDQIQSLCNFQMVHRVGISHDRLVAHVHSRQWFMPSKGGNIPYRPWSTTSSKDPDATLLRKYCNGVLGHIIANPGVTLHQLANHFSGMLQRNSLREILQLLKVANCIQSYSFSSLDACTAFCSPSSQYCSYDSSSQTQADRQIFYEAKLSLLL